MRPARDLVFVATADAALVGLDARTGVVRWETQVADHELGYSYTSGPIVAEAKVITGIGGCTRLQAESCFITAHDARTGRDGGPKRGASNGRPPGDQRAEPS